MYYKSSFSFLIIVIAAGLSSLVSCCWADIVTNIDGVQVRSGGPFGNGDIALTGGGTIAASHGSNPLTWNFTVSNQDLDGDGSTDDSFTFDLIATTTNANGVSVWGQGINNSNGAGTNTSFGSLEGVSFSVANVVGTTTGGSFPIVFDGFTGTTVAAGAGGDSAPANINRAIDINGTTFSFDNNPTANGFVFLQQNHDFAAVSSVLLDNQGVADSGRAASGSLVVRALDFQFRSVMSVPEPSSLALLGLAGCFVATRRRKK